jgi:hypothetical protein
LQEESLRSTPPLRAKHAAGSRLRDIQSRVPGLRFTPVRVSGVAAAVCMPHPGTPFAIAALPRTVLWHGCQYAACSAIFHALEGKWMHDGPTHRAASRIVLLHTAQGHDDAEAHWPCTSCCMPAGLGGSFGRYAVVLAHTLAIGCQDTKQVLQVLVVSKRVSCRRKAILHSLHRVQR